MRRILSLAAAMLALMLVATLPSMGADDGTISATVATPTAPAPCMTLSQTAVDFGTHPFQIAGSDLVGQEFLFVYSCAGSGVNQDLLVNATDAVSADTADTWTLLNTADVCATGPDTFRLRVESVTSFQTVFAESGIYQAVGFIIGNSSDELDVQIGMPCVGSNGEGETMLFDINFLVTIA